VFIADIACSISGLSIEVSFRDEVPVEAL